MSSLESLCIAYLQASDSEQKRSITEKIAEIFYSDPRVSRILEAELRRASLSIDRKNDLRHDLFIEFTSSVLPKLKYPERAIGAVKATAINCVRRLNSNRYSTEDRSTVFLDDPDSGIQVEDIVGVDNTQENRIIEDMMTQRAKAAIEGVMANPSTSTIKTKCWVRTGFPTRPEYDGQPQRVPVKKLPPAKVLGAKPPRYRELNLPHEPTETAKWFLDARERVALSVNTLAERLQILPATLRSYLDSRVHLPLDVYERMQKLMNSAEAKEREAVHARTKDMDMPKIISDWKERTGVQNLRELAAVLGRSPGVVHRWSRLKEDGTDSRPYPETVYDCEQKVVFYEKAMKRKGKAG